MDKSKVLKEVLVLLKAAKENPEQFAELSKGGGINPQSKRHKQGVSVVGGHIRDKADPVIPLKEQREDNVKKLKSMPKANLPKSEKNPDEKEDAELGEQVEQAVEDHMLENKDAEEKEGHKIMKKSVLDTAKELLKMAKENPARFEELTKSLAPAAAPAPKPAMPKAAMPKPPVAKQPTMKAPGMQKEEDCTENKQAQGGLMTKEEIKADLKQEWKPKFKKG